MNILILGYGKMGKTIEQILKKRQHNVTAVDNSRERGLLEMDTFDVAIEFSQPDAAVDNIKYCLENNIPVVVGTTGWLNRKPEIEEHCNKMGGTFLYASNFSIGVNIFFKLNQWLSKKMNSFPNYSTKITETHHIHKVDAPSGTAITLGEDIIKNLDSLKEWKPEKDGQGILPIYSEREGEVPGTHIVSYKSEVDSIQIKHEAHSREGFAMGAVLVAEWIKDKKGILTMDDFLNI